MCLTGKKRKELKNQPQQKQNNDNREENRGALCGICVLYMNEFSHWFFMYLTFVSFLLLAMSAIHNKTPIHHTQSTQPNDRRKTLKSNKKSKGVCLISSQT